VILLWGSEGSEEAELLLDAAEAAGITAKDLTAGLDDISFAAETHAEPEAEPEPEPEPEPEEPRRRGRRGRRAEPETAEPEEEPLTEDAPQEEAPKPEPRRRGRKAAEPVEEEQPVEEEKESLQETIARAQHKAQQKETDKPVPDAEIDLLLIRAALEGAYNSFRLEDERNAIINQADVRERPLTELLRKALHTLPETGEQKQKAPETAEEPEGDQGEQSSPRRRRGRPRDENKTFAYLVDDEGNYTRRGRGRIPAGQTVVQLTRAEIEEKGLELDSE
jgi:hypothetical protein